MVWSRGRRGEGGIQGRPRVGHEPEWSSFTNGDAGGNGVPAFRANGGRDPRDAESMRLVKRFKAGDELAFNRLFRLWQGDVYAYARAALGGHERAEDARQDVFLNILESIADFEPDCESAFRRWLFTIARNRVINIKEQEGRLRFLPVEEMDKLREHLADPDANVDHVLDWIKDEELFTLFERLPVAQRQALTLRCCEDLDRKSVV